MTPTDFRRIALGLQGVVEGAHMGHPDFRVDSRIFATLHADKLHGMVKLTPDQQRQFIREQPNAFVPENGAWGRAGCTRVVLAAADIETLGNAMTLAWQNTVRHPSRRSQAKARPTRRTGATSRNAKKR